MNLIYKTIRDPNVGFRIKSERQINMWKTWFIGKPGDVILTQKHRERPEDSDILSKDDFKHHLASTRPGKEVCIQIDNEKNNKAK